MNASLVILLLASSASPTTQANTLGAPGCGPVNVKFDVKTESGQRAVPSPEPGKALLFLLQDDAKFGSTPRPTTRFGIDGTWVGATHANSYFYVFVDPGERHLCANWQSWIGPVPTRSTAATHFIAEAGKTYFFRAEDIAMTERPGGPLVAEPEVVLELVDSDEGQVLTRSFAFSSSHPKK
jgi:hypothetical protein